MKMTHPNCAVCNGRNFNAAGIVVAEAEVIPFFKRELLKLRYPTYPFPRKYDGLLASLFAYSQALAYNRAHGITAVYYTENKWMLKFGSELQQKFGMATVHVSELKVTPREVCEFNIQKVGA